MSTFDTLKIYTGEELDLGNAAHTLVEYGYHSVKKAAEEGDFSVLGDTLTVYPVTFQYPLKIELSVSTVEKIRSLDPVTYEPIEEHNVAIILPIKGTHRRRISRKGVLPGPESPIDNFVDIEPGDYVVHIEHGIGKYLGVEKIKVSGKYSEHLAISYAGQDKLLVPFGDIDKIHKYLGFEKRLPRLDKLGSKLWSRAKERARSGVARIAVELLEMQAKRAAAGGFAFPADNDWQAGLEKDFPYKETPDQARSSAEVKKDMELPKPMDRLLCGDVGYGKTEVAMRAAFKAVMGAKQVAILVPTTILAEQHYKTFTGRMKKYPVNVAMLSRFRTARQQAEIVKAIRDGSVDIVIGTHRLLSGDASFKDLGLVIIDEEQRFGVRQKEHLKKLRLSVDVLTLTATPIPRTLYLALMGGRDISVINTPPSARMPVVTKIAHYDEILVREALLKEKRRGGQSFFVHNRIDGIEKLAKSIKSLVPSLNLVVAHGRMPERYLEKTMIDFIDGKIDCLLSTTIIESGIDIPNANTIIINRADALGLSELYQLRGRVGRFSREAYAYLLIPKKTVLSSESQKRLTAINKFHELGSGFKLAMEDLQIRGAGNLLGTEQHGYINSVGFDLYCRLLKSAIDKMGGS
jgi:transcription-repair coupling factor (superfamily II helicase)